MRILLVADIHANWPAIRALNEPHDLCLCLGDLVDYGPDPSPCIEWARTNALVTVRGNHDHGVAQNVLVNARTGFKNLTGLTRPVSRQRCSPSDQRFLAALPVSRYLTLEKMRFFLVHASPRDPLDEYAPPEVEFWERRLEHIDAEVICVGHTHQPYVLEVGGKLVINPGSIGQPRDGDPRASYAIIEDFKVELKRYEYPVEESVAAIDKSPLADSTKARLIDILRNGGPRLPPPAEKGATT